MVIIFRIIPVCSFQTDSRIIPVHMRLLLPFFLFLCPSLPYIYHIILWPCHSLLPSLPPHPSLPSLGGGLFLLWRPGDSISSSPLQNSLGGGGILHSFLSLVLHCSFCAFLVVGSLFCVVVFCCCVQLPASIRRLWNIHAAFCTHTHGMAFWQLVRFWVFVLMLGPCLPLVFLSLSVSSLWAWLCAAFFSVPSK